MEQKHEIELLKAKVDSLEKAQLDLLRYTEQVQANVKELGRYQGVAFILINAATILSSITLLSK